MKNRTSVVFLFAGVVLLNARAAWTIGPTFGPPLVQDPVYYYDTEGRGGCIAAAHEGEGPGTQPYINVNLGGNAEFYRLNNLDHPLLTFDAFSVSFATGVGGIPPMSPGTPYYIRRHHPDFGCISTFGYVGATYAADYWPAIIVPIPFSAYQVPNREIDLNDSDPEGLTIALHNSIVADDKDSVSLGVELAALVATLPVSQAPYPNVTIEYLPGNTLSGTIHWQPDNPYLGVSLHWGNPLPGGPRADVLELGTPAPEGPMRVTIMYDGYTSDSLTLEPIKTKGYLYYPLFEATTGLSPSGYVPQAGIMDQGVADSLLGACDPSATLSPALDPNQDAISDAADFTIPDPPQD